MRTGSSWPNGMISDVKEKDDELMMKNGVNSMRMERKKTIWCHYRVSSPSGPSLCICNMMTPPCFLYDFCQLKQRQKKHLEICDQDGRRLNLPPEIEPLLTFTRMFGTSAWFTVTFTPFQDEVSGTCRSSFWSCSGDGVRFNTCRCLMLTVMFVSRPVDFMSKCGFIQSPGCSSFR